MKINKDKLITILLAIILLLIVTLTYFFLIKPKINNHLYELQAEAYNQGVLDVVSYILNQIDEEGFAQIEFENQTRYLVEYLGEQNSS